MRRVLLSVLLIGLVSASAIGVTQAYFSDQGESSGNTFSAGTLDLKLSDSDESVADDVTATWSGNNMAPGGTPVVGTVQLRNSGSIPADHIEVTASNNCSEPDMDSYLEIVSASYDGGGIWGMINDNNGNGYKDLDDLEQPDGSNTGLDNLLLADLGIDHPFSLQVRLHPSTPNNYQGKSCTTTFTFVLNQDASQ